MQMHREQGYPAAQQAVSPDRTTGLLHHCPLGEFRCCIFVTSTVLPGPVHAALGRLKHRCAWRSASGVPHQPLGGESVTGP
jgi:hypothetical protein